VIYTGVFQDKDGHFHFETHVATHDRTAAWHQVHDARSNKKVCLIMLIDGQANVKTYRDIVDTIDK
jgi:carbonic anhydrase